MNEKEDIFAIYIEALTQFEREIERIKMSTPTKTKILLERAASSYNLFEKKVNGIIQKEKDEMKSIYKEKSDHLRIRFEKEKSERLEELRNKANKNKEKANFTFGK